MMKALSLSEIEKLLMTSSAEESFSALLDFVKREPQNERGWYLLGGIYRRQQMWAEAIDAYNRSKMISPDGPADAAIESIYETLRTARVEI